MYKLILAAPLLVSCSTHTYVNLNPHVPADEVILQMDFDGCMQQANAANAQQFASMTQSTGLMEANSYSDPNAQLAQALVQVFLMGFMALATEIDDSGQVDISLLSGLAGVAASITASGPFSFDLDSTGYVGFKRAFAGGAAATITDIKVITVLDYANGAVQELGAYSAEYSAEYGA